MCIVSVYEFQVMLKTLYGEAWSHKVVFDGEDTSKLGH